MRKPIITVNTATFFALILFVLLADVQAASIAGSIRNSSGKTGWVFVNTNHGNGTAVRFTEKSETTKSFEIMGVSPGSKHTVSAWMDTTGSGIHHANDPASVTMLVEVPYNSVSVPLGSQLALDTPATSLPAAPETTYVVRGNGTTFLYWNGKTNGDSLPIADSYTVSWSSDGVNSTASISGIPSREDNFWNHTSTNYSHYKIEAVRGTDSAATGWIPVSVPLGGVTVTAAVAFPGITPGGPLIAMLMGEQQGSFSAVTAPGSPQTVTFNNVQPDTYNLRVFLDNDHNGCLSAGDIRLPASDEPLVTVGTAPVSAPLVTLAAREAFASVATQHLRQEGRYQSYTLEFMAAGMTRRPVKVSIIDGKHILLPLDMAFNPDGDFTSYPWIDYLRPAVGDSYTFALTYDDESTSTITAQVTGVIDTFAEPTAPLGQIPFSPQPVFSWTAPAFPPAGHLYEVFVKKSDNGNWTWSSDYFPPSQLSASYNDNGNAPPLLEGTSYNWGIVTRSPLGNSSSNSITFTPTSGPYIIGFSPAAGTAGSTIAIEGQNFGTSGSVTFGTYIAPITFWSPTKIIAQVPDDLATGRITVTSAGKAGYSTPTFQAGMQAITLKGRVIDSSGNPAADAVVQLDGNPAVSSVTITDGSFAVSGYPGGRLLISKRDYVKVISQEFGTVGDLDFSSTPFVLLTRQQLAERGVSAVETAAFILAAEPSGTRIEGATLTVKSFRSETPLAVTYFNSTGTMTSPNGLAAILPAIPYDWFTIQAIRTGLSFNQQSCPVYLDHIAEILLAPLPVITSSNISAAPGERLTINGRNFSNLPDGNIVRSNGVRWVVSAATPDQLTVIVPEGVKSGFLNISTIGGQALSHPSFTALRTLNVDVSGTGTVTSSSTKPGLPSHITCNGGRCSAGYPFNSLVNLTATPAWYSRIVWGGACSGSGACGVIMSDNKAVSATFIENQNARLGNVSYPTIQSACGAATADATILARDSSTVVFLENLVFDQPYRITLDGGKDQSWSSSGGASLIEGSLTIKSGSVAVSGVEIR